MAAINIRSWSVDLDKLEITPFDGRALRRSPQLQSQRLRLGASAAPGQRFRAARALSNLLAGRRDVNPR